MYHQIHSDPVNPEEPLLKRSATNAVYSAYQDANSLDGQLMKLGTWAFLQLSEVRDPEPYTGWLSGVSISRNPILAK
jgi:hypothetical protein